MTFGCEAWASKPGRDLPGLTRRILLCPGERSLTTEDGIELLPFEEFARVIVGGTLWA